MDAPLPAYIVDLSEDPVVVGRVDGAQARVCTEVAGLFPFAVGVRESASGVEVVAGPAYRALQAGNRRGDALLFDQLGHNLPRIGETEVQTGIIAGFWEAIWQQVRSSPEPQPPGSSALPACDLYLIVPATYSPALCDTLHRVLSTTPSHYRLRHSFNEMLCAIVHYIESPLLAEHVGPEPRVVTIIEGRSARDIRVLHMRCTQTPAAWHIRPLYRMRGRLGSPAFARRFASAMPQDGETSLCFVRTADKELQSKLQTVLETAHLRRSAVFWPTDDAAVCQEVQMRGAMRLVQRLHGESQGAQEVCLEPGYRLGVSLGTDQVHVLIAPETIAPLEVFPLTQSRAFEVRGPLAHSLRFNLCCGYSESAEDTMQLGHLELDRAYGRGLDHFEVVIAWTLETPTSGKVTLSCVPLGGHEPVLVDQTAFRFPGLVT